MFIILQIFFATRMVREIGEYGPGKTASHCLKVTSLWRRRSECGYKNAHEATCRLCHVKLFSRAGVGEGRGEG